MGKKNEEVCMGAKKDVYNKLAKLLIALGPPTGKQMTDIFLFLLI